MNAPEPTLLDRLRQEDDPRAAEIVALAGRVAGHPLFGRLRSLAAVRTFMEHHVWAVWDFMSLLKSIQAAIAPVTLPWRPPVDAAAARFINEIVVGEEGDVGPDGEHASHFEIYLRAMDAAGADSAPVRAFVAALANRPWTVALAEAQAPAAARAFVRRTLEICAAPLPARVAGFTLGREEIIPDMFRGVLRELDVRAGGDVSGFLWYLERHVAIDGDLHAPLAARLFTKICLVDRASRTLAFDAARDLLAQRLALWDAIDAAID